MSKRGTFRLKKTTKVAKKPVKKSRAKAKAKKTSSVVTEKKTTTTVVTETVVTSEPATPRRTIVSFILDESGSMASTQDITANGFNEYVETLQNKGGKAIFSLTKFSSGGTNIVHDGITLDKVARLTRQNYQPNGGTPLFDAIGKTINSIDTYLSRIITSERPAVMVVIMTDGQENESREFNRAQINTLVKAKEAAGWAFVYLGANHDAFGAGTSIGISVANISGYSISNIGGAFAGVANATATYTSSVTRGLSPMSSSVLSAEDRKTIEAVSSVGQYVGVDASLQGTPHTVVTTTGNKLDGVVTK